MQPFATRSKREEVVLLWGLALGLLACTEPPDDDPPDEVVDEETPGNTPPRAFADQIEVRQGQSLTFDPTENDRDPDDDRLVVRAVSVPEEGTAEIVDDTRVSYTAPPDFAGEDRFDVTVDDQRGGVSTAEVTVQVLAEVGLTIVSPAANEERSAGAVTVTVGVAGCNLLGVNDRGCLIRGTLDDVPIEPPTAAAFVVQTEINGPTTLALELVPAAGGAYDPPVEASVTWTTVDGRDPGEFVGDIVFGSAADMSQFCDDGFVSVTGSVTITTTSDLDVVGLSCLERVRGALSVSDTSLQQLALPALVEVTGPITLSSHTDLQIVDLPVLQTAGDLVMFGNDALTSLSLPRLSEVAGGVDIDDHDLLTVLDLDGLETVGTDLVVRSAPLLTEIDLPSLSSVGDVLRIVANAELATLSLPLVEDTRDVAIAVVPKLETLEMPLLKTVNGSLEIRGGVLDVVSFPALETVAIDFEVRESATMTSFAAPLLATVGETLLLRDNLALVVVDVPLLGALGSLDVLGCHVLPELTVPASSLLNFYVQGNDGLTTLSLPSLQSVFGAGVDRNRVLSTLDLGSLAAVTTNLSLDDNALSTLSLPNLTSVNQRLDISDNGIAQLDLSALTSVGALFLAREEIPTAAFPLLTSTTNRLDVRQNPQLEALHLPQLQDVATELFIFDNPNLATVTVPVLATVTERLLVEDNPQLVGLSLPQLVDLGRLDVRSNAALAQLVAPRVTQVRRVELTELPSLITFDLTALATIGPFANAVDGGLRVVSNDVLATVGGLGALTDVAGDLEIRFNPQLPQSEAQALAVGINVGGTTQVENNGP